MNTDLHPQLAELTSTIDNLQSALEPLLSTTALSTTASKLPLLDKAKLYALTTYAIESLLFSYLRLHGHDAKAHPVFAELSRVKAYFGKIQAAENAGAGSSSGGAANPRRLDADAAARFVRHGLAGNDRIDSARADALAREIAGAKRRAEELGVGTHTRFDGAAKRMKAQEAGQGGGQVAVVSAAELGDSEYEAKEGEGGEDAVEGAVQDNGKKRKRGRKGQRDEKFGAMAGLDESLVQATGTTTEEDWSDHVRVPAETDGQGLPTDDEARRLRRMAKKERKRHRTGEETKG